MIGGLSGLERSAGHPLVSGYQSYREIHLCTTFYDDRGGSGVCNVAFLDGRLQFAGISVVVNYDFKGKVKQRIKAAPSWHRDTHGI